MGDEAGLQHLKVFIEKSGGLELAASRLAVRPSTLRKVIAGRSISPPTRAKLNTIIEKHTMEKWSVSPRRPLFEGNTFLVFAKVFCEILN